MANLNLNGFDRYASGYIGYNAAKGFYYSESDPGDELAAVWTSEKESGGNVLNLKSLVTSVTYSGTASWIVRNADGSVTSFNLGNGADWVQGLTLSKKDTNISTGGGNDRIDIDNASVKTNIDMGAGNDSVFIKSAADTTKIVTGADNDRVDVTLASSAAISIDGGEGNDTIYLHGSVGNAAVAAGSGNNYVDVLTNVSGNLAFTSGNGNDTVYLRDVGGKADISVGAGNDRIDVLADVSGDLSVDLGEGTDTLYVRGVKGNLNITGNGKDAKKIELMSKVDGKVSINLGSGNDTVAVNGGTLSGTVALGNGNNLIDSFQGTNPSFIDAAITTGSGKDIIYGEHLEASTVSTGAGADEISFDGGAKDSTINLGDGNDEMDFDGEGRSGTEALLNTSVYGGNGNDSVYVNMKADGALIDGGAGNDYLLAGPLFTGDVSLASGKGRDTIDVSYNYSGNGTITLMDFDADKDTLLVKDALTKANVDNDGNVSLNGGAKLKVNQTAGCYALHVSVSGGGESYLAWGGNSNAVMNGSNMKKPLTLFGNSDEDVVDTLIGGSKSDTIDVGTGNYAYGGAGNDSIILSSSTTDTPEFVGLAAAGGKDTVSGFQTVAAAGDAENADVIYLFENNLSNLKLKSDEGRNLVTKVGTATLTLDGVDTSSEAAINVKDSTGKTYEVDYVGGTASVAGDIEAMSDIYYGGSDSATIDFTAVDDNLVVDLGNRAFNVNGTSLVNTNGSSYYGEFASITGGKDNTVMMGSADNAETLTAGAGNTTLWGGGRKGDLLVGSSDSAAHQVFYYGAGDGKDTIQSGNWGVDEGADILWLGSGEIAGVKNDGNNTTVKLGSGDNLTLAGVSDVDTAVQYSTDGRTVRAAKIGRSGQANAWTYDADATDYIGGKGNSLTVGSNADDASIWLDGSDGRNYDSVNTVDASANAGNLTLAGSTANEALIAGSGASSLWGGAGNDTLTSGAGGITEFYFGLGDGNDIITASGSDDKVVLYNVSFENVAGVEEKTSGMKLTLTDGSTLIVAGSASTYRLGDGAVWHYDTAEKSWSRA